MANGTHVTAGPPQRYSSEIAATVDGPNGSKLTLSTTGDAADGRRATAVLVVALKSLFVIVVAVLLSWWEARRLAAPLATVAGTADEMGAGDLGSRAALTAMLEIDAVADALNRLADRVNELLQAEREFSSNASHQF